MNIFSDYLGHSDLYYSLHALFEKRLSGELFTPDNSDLEWKNFFSLNPSIPVCERLESDNDAILNSNIECDKHEWIDDIHCYYRKKEVGKNYHCIQKAITFKKFLEMDIDVIITTYWGHEKGAYNLVKKHKPNAIFIRQIANIHERPLGYCKNILLGAAYHPRDYGFVDPNEGFKNIGVNHIMYYPEQYEGYCYTEPTNHKLVLNLAPDLIPADAEVFHKFKTNLKDFTFKICGRNPVYKDCHQYSLPDGTIPHLLLPKTIKESGFIWYSKIHGGGGYTFRQALACGRPVIGRKRYSHNHTIIESELYQHGINCIDLDIVGDDTTLLREWGELTRHIEVCKTVAENFQNATKFEEKAKEIKDWIYILPRGVI